MSPSGESTTNYIGHLFRFIGQPNTTVIVRRTDRQTIEKRINVKFDPRIFFMYVYMHVQLYDYYLISMTFSDY